MQASPETHGKQPLRCKTYEVKRSEVAKQYKVYALQELHSHAIGVSWQRSGLHHVAFFNTKQASQDAILRSGIFWRNRSNNCLSFVVTYVSCRTCVVTLWSMMTACGQLPHRVVNDHTVCTEA